MENKPNKILEFISKHKTFIKKVILFILSYFTIVVVNSDAFTNLFYQLFGQEFTNTLQMCSPLMFITTMEV